MNCPKCGYPHASETECKACGWKRGEEPTGELTREGQVEARVTELTEGNSRRELEAMARGLGITPSKSEYPNKDALARAIVEKEFP